MAEAAREEVRGVVREVVWRLVGMNLVRMLTRCLMVVVEVVGVEVEAAEGLSTTAREEVAEADGAAEATSAARRQQRFLYQESASRISQLSPRQ